jgi:hypothetical protein
MPHATPMARAGAAAAQTVEANAAPARLPERDARAAPIAMKSFVEVADSLRTFVAKEVQGVKEAVSRAASHRPKVPPPAALSPTDDTVRKLLGRMRTMMQEERFRSGKIR